MSSPFASVKSSELMSMFVFTTSLDDKILHETKLLKVGWLCNKKIQTAFFLEWLKYM